MARYRNTNSTRSIFSELHAPDGSVLVLDPGEEVELDVDPQSVHLVPVDSAPSAGWSAGPVTAAPAEPDEDESPE